MPPPCDVAVERGALVRVLAVAQHVLRASQVAPTQPGKPEPSSSGATTLPNQEATATSYAAVCRNAASASARRCASVVPPGRERVDQVARTGRARSTIATFAWFLAAPRTIAGPPMSICSTTASGSAPDATVSVNG